ncbi:hypothetical protein OG318_49150 [Streptomyces sp. NBC_01483]|nr:hypothetical protein [Streptomyces sp. NBC_01483]
MDGSGARGVDELDAVRGQWGAQSHDHLYHAHPDAQAGGLRDVVTERVRGAFLPAAVGEPHGGSRGFAFPRRSGERGHRYGSGGQDVAFE